MRLLAWGPISEQGGDCPTLNQGTKLSKESTGFLPTGQASVMPGGIHDVEHRIAAERHREALRRFHRPRSPPSPG